MRALFTILFSALFFTTLAQNATLKGKVTDAKTGEELIGVNVVYAEGKGVSTNPAGDYIIELAEGTYTVNFRYVGYENQKKSVTLKAGQELVLNIKLAEQKAVLDEVVVSAGRYDQKIGDVPVSIQVIKPQLIESRVTTSPEQIVEMVPGVTVQENQISIRGGSGFSYGSGSRVLILVDDVPMLTGDAGDVKWTALPFENIAQMEVIKGASSVLYGSSALNGVIHIRSDWPSVEPKTKINIFSGVYDNPYARYRGISKSGGDSLIDSRNQRPWKGTEIQQESGFNFSHSRIIKNNLDFVISGNFTNDEGYRLGENDSRGRISFNTRYRSKKYDGLSYGLNGSGTITQGTIFFIWQNADSVLYPQGLLDTATTTLSDYRGFRINLDPHLTYFNKKGDKFNVRSRFYRTENVNNTNQASTAYVYFLDLNYQKKWESGYVITTGITGTYNEVLSELYGDHNSNNLAAYAQLDKKWNRVTATAGMRAEYFRIDDEESESSFSIKKGDDFIRLPVQPVVRAGLTYQPFEETYLRGSFGQGYRFPTIAEKFVSTSVGLLNIFPNNQLIPERGWSGEIGVKQGMKIGKFMGYLDVAGFINRYDDMMEFTFGAFNPLTNRPFNLNDPQDVATMFALFNQGYGLTDFLGFQAQNNESARILGGEITLMGKMKIREVEISGLTGYTFLDPISLNSSNEYKMTLSDTTQNRKGYYMLKYRNRHLFKADIQADYKKFSVGISSRYSSFMQNIDAVFEESIIGGVQIVPGLKEYREARAKGDWIFDLRTSYQITKGSTLALVVKNALNREYSTRPADVAPPRMFMMQYGLKF
jgi:outer membrane receptor protein involved in Fe transport